MDGGQPLFFAVWRDLRSRQNRRSTRRLQTLTTAKTAEADHWQQPKPPKQIPGNRLNRRSVWRLFAQQVLPEWRGADLTKGLEADGKSTASVLKELRSWLVGDGNVKKLRSKGVGQGAKVEMPVQVDHQLGRGWGWSSMWKRIQVVSADRLVLSLRHAWHMSFDQALWKSGEPSWRNPCVASPTMLRHLDPLDVCLSLPGADSSGRVKQLRIPTVDSDLGIGRGDSPKYTLFACHSQSYSQHLCSVVFFGWQPDLKRML